MNEEEIKYIQPNLVVVNINLKECIVTASGGFTPGQDSSDEFGPIT